MSARARLTLATLLASAAAAACGGGDGARARNVVLISIDTCRADRLSCYGFPLETTPNLDALARAGVLFEQASATDPITLPSHASLLTGTLPPRHRVFDNQYRLGDASETLAETLAARGFRTAAFVSAFVLDARFGTAQGFEVYDDELGLEPQAGGAQAELINERRAEETNRAALAWLEGHHRERFFLFLHYFDPHARYDPPAPFDQRFQGDPYAGEIAYVDRCVGDVVARLERLGRLDDTLIVVTSDHGESLNEHGEPSHSYFAYQATLRVPLIVRAPGGLAGVRVREPVSLVDVAPTALAALGLQAVRAHAGRDLSPALYEPGAVLGEAPIYGESLYPTKYRAAALRALRRGRWKYVWTVEPELYDLEADPGELSDLYAREPERASALEAELRELVLRHAAAGEASGGAPEVDPQAAARLRALGYADAGVRDALEFDPHAVDAKARLDLHNRLLAVHLLTADAELERAHALGSELVLEYPWLLEAHGLLGGIRARQGRPAEAAAHYEAYLREVEAERARDPAGASGALAAGQAVALVALADLDLELGRPERAAGSYRRALELTPTSFDALMGLAGLLSQGQRRFAEAAQLYRRAVAARADSQMAHANLANCLYASGQLEPALEHYRRALELGPDTADLRVLLGGVLTDLGRPREALEPLEAAAAAQPDDPRAHAALGAARLELGETERAAGSFRRALELRADLRDAALGLARCRRAAGDEAGARAQLAAFVRALPASVGPLARAALELASHPDAQRRHPEDALLVAEVLDAASGGARVDVLDALAVALAANGRFEEAVGALQRALERVGSQDPAVAQRLGARLELFAARRPFVRRGAP